MPKSRSRARCSGLLATSAGKGSIFILFESTEISLRDAKFGSRAVNRRRNEDVTAIVFAVHHILVQVSAGLNHVFLSL